MYSDIIDKAIKLNDSYIDENDDWKGIKYSNEAGLYGPKVLHGKSRTADYYVRGVSAKKGKKHV